MRSIVSICFLLVLVSCNNVARYGYEPRGADEFVIDSYKIRQGKFSILEMQGEISEALPGNTMMEYKDVIHDNDILNIAVYHPSREDIIAAVAAISNAIGYRVTNGTVVLPDIVAPVKVSGLTIEEARQALRNAYLEQIRDVEVFVSYKERLTKKVDLAGSVATPAIPVDGKIRLYEVIARAKIPQDANLFMSYVIRDDTPLPVDIDKLIKHGDMSHNIVMHGGDKVYIADSNDARIMLMGEVGNPKALSLPSGVMSLREALVSAGGIPYTGDKRCIQVIRGNLSNPKIYTLSWNHIIHLPNESLLLMHGDTVYVGAKPITEWNRFISQLLPSFTGIQTAKITSRVLGIN